MPIPFIRVATWHRPILWPPPVSGLFNIRLPANGYPRCSPSVRRISARAASGTGRTDPEGLGLAADAQLVVTADHRLALGSRPALPRATAKKALSSLCCPLFACRVFASTAGAAAVAVVVKELRATA